MMLASTLVALTLSGGSMDGYRRSIDAWHAARVERLTAPDGWLALAGLYWLEEGENRFGAAADNELVFPPAAPARIGTLVRRGREVEARIEPGVPVTSGGERVTRMKLASDRGGKPTMLELGSFVFFVIERGDAVGLRLRDRESPARAQFRGIERFPVRSEWRIEARFEPYSPPRELAVPTVLGTVDRAPSPGAVVFTAGGASHRLDAVLEPGEDELFIIFADATNGSDTYGAGRFLYAPVPDAAGKVVLDFNKAYNPPCAFTRFATCPLPPPQNRLRLRVEAGEKKYGDH